MLRLALSLAAGLVLLELALRLLLFGGGVLARLGAPLRRAELYARAETDELWFTLALAFDGGPELARVPAAFDPELGWVGESFDPATFRHRNEAHVGARRTVLLYGDSFAACGRHKATCWDAELERSPLGADHALLNYGVSGYGLDQILLLFERTIDLHAARDPLVLVGVFVDDDLDRAGQRLTTAPKPWFELEQGNLVYHAPLADSRLGFLRAAPPRPASFVWRRFLRTGILPEEWSASLAGVPAKVAETAALDRLLLRRFQAGLEARGLSAVFVLFHGRASIGVESFGWQEPLLLEELTALGLPHVSTRTEFQADMRRTGRRVNDYFVSRGKLTYHYSAEAQEIAFGAIQRALEGEFDGREGARLAGR